MTNKSKFHQIREDDINFHMEMIARKHLSIETLEERKMDDLDFHNVSVWGVKAALRAAYDFGYRTGCTDPCPIDEVNAD